MALTSSLVAELTALLGAGGVMVGADDLAPYTTDWRGKIKGAALCVVCPASVDEVAAVVGFAAHHRIGLVPQGGNTGLCGGATPDATGNQIVLSLRRLHRIRTVDALNNTLTAESGCVLATIQEAAANAERLFPLSLAAEGSSQIGGLVSTNAGGTQVVRYGNMRDLVLGLEVVLPDGSIISELGGLRKNNTGYDLKQLFIGAEGTLGIVTAATLKLYPRRAGTGTALVAVPDLNAATRLLRALQTDWGDAVTSFEIASDLAVRLVLKHFPTMQRPFGGEAPFYCLLELSAGARQDPASVVSGIEATLADAAAAGLIVDGTVARSPAQARALWKLREEITESERREGVSVKHDVSAAIGEIPTLVAEVTAQVEQRFAGTRVLVFGHLGDGSLHLNVILPAETAAAGIQNDLFRLVHDLVDQHGGSFSAEHGIGQLKRDELARYKGAASLKLMRTIKQALDPLGIMNPGKVLPD